MKNFWTILLLCTFAACGDNEKDKKDDVIFFQVKQFFEKELQDIEQTPYYIYKLEIDGDRRDSTNIPSDSVAYYAKPFLESDINETALKKHFEESVFQDQTTNSFSLNYATANKELEVQNVNVLLYEDGETVKRIFIRRFINTSGNSVIEQLSWKPNESFEINRLMEQQGQEEKTKRTIVVWNPK